MISQNTELEDILDNLHVCDDEGRGCEYQDYYVDGQRYTRCRLKNQNVEAIQSLITQARREGQTGELELLMANQLDVSKLIPVSYVVGRLAELEKGVKDGD